MYYGKQGTVWNIQANQASWMVRKILQAYKDLEVVGWNEARVIQVEKFSTKQMYQLLRGEYPKVEWRKLVCNTIACPKWSLILYLTLQGRLLTKKRLIACGSVDNTKCILCEDGNENIEHLFFSCPYSRQVWQKILQWQNIQKQASRWNEEQRWAHDHYKGNSPEAKIFRTTLAASVYNIWQERNHRRRLEILIL
ncbi:hypothetical protein R3W88_000572 [Solanum pinnatisectum]|uniref:Reverse transcriptase zinc-binding domain-containing protein n=1 Tax=Solanum pinnatisectum TaxID=50273 RepID=A0AAV9MIM6_9SOLN|nr:hypothetical protein R3W88_000572 [Solanum pinnatisectum]